jgi:hypothetical protein
MTQNTKAQDGLFFKLLPTKMRVGPPSAGRFLVFGDEDGEVHPVAQISPFVNVFRYEWCLYSLRLTYLIVALCCRSTEVRPVLGPSNNIMFHESIGMILLAGEYPSMPIPVSSVEPLRLQFPEVIGPCGMLASGAVCGQLLLPSNEEENYVGMVRQSREHYLY